MQRPLVFNMRSKKEAGKLDRRGPEIEVSWNMLTVLVTRFDSERNTTLPNNTNLLPTALQSDHLGVRDEVAESVALGIGRELSPQVHLHQPLDLCVHVTGFRG